MKIKFGALVVAGSGKVGGHVVARNKGGAYMRTKTTPSNPRTSFQQAARALLSSLSTAWRTLTDSQRLSWNGAVAQFATTDIFGDIRNPSGINLFVKLNANLSNIGESFIYSAPEKIEVPFSPINIAQLFVSANSTVIGFDDTNLDDIACLVYATPPVSDGKTNVNNLFRVIGHAVVADNQLTLAGAYLSKFGAYSGGQSIYFKVVPIVNTGQQGTPQIVKATILA